MIIKREEKDGTRRKYELRRLGKNDPFRKRYGAMYEYTYSVAYMRWGVWEKYHVMRHGYGNSKEECTNRLMGI